MPNNPLAQVTSVISIADAVVPRDGNSRPRGSAPMRERPITAAGIAAAPSMLQSALSAALASCGGLAATGASLLELERAVATDMAGIAQRVLGWVFATACREAMLRDLRGRGLSIDQVRIRTDEDGYATVHTTFGPVTFPVFAYRDLTSPCGSTIHRPAHQLLPFHRVCRSSPLCLEWEVRLGATHPFRKAEEMFNFFTRGVSTVEDTTISRHILTLSEMVSPDWLYRTPDDIRRVLRERATRDRKTGAPLLYFSSDAHALRRYVGATWATEQKMVNGIRLWCEDARTGQVIHLGGEFTWGDCHAVGARVRELLHAGILPNADEEWKATNPRLVFISDGTEWFKSHILPHLPDAVPILDPYHVIEWFTAFIKVAFGGRSKRGKALSAVVQCILFGKRPRQTPKPAQNRRGHKKARQNHTPHAHDRPWLYPGRPRTSTSDATCNALIELLDEIDLRRASQLKARENLRSRLADNAARMDYVAHLARGLQIGSGAMESLHRSGSQQRLKLPGATWRHDSSQALLTFRMLELSGRWNEFWRQKDLSARIAVCFEHTPQHDRDATGQLHPPMAPP